MNAKIWLINLVLAVFIIVLGTNAYNVWTQNPLDIKSHLRPASDSKKFDEYETRVKMPSESVYRAIADKNLFSPERREFVPEIPVEESVPEVKEIKISGKKITLYGVIILADYKKALIDNPIRKNGERPNKWVKVGDKVGNLKVAAIQKNSIFFQDGAKQYEVLLYDNEKQRSAGSSPGKSSAPNVISTEAKKKEAAAPAKVSPKNDEEFEIIETPFGKIKRKKK